MKKRTTFGKNPDRLSQLLAIGLTGQKDQTMGEASGNVTLEDFTEIKPGACIGRYTLLETVGEGGMATVYMAEQKRPIRRRVAVKLIKLGMDTKQVIARFEAERQALALMDHPNIAKVLDAGATDSGRPYFVMELVKGLPITEFCDRNHLTTQERLDLFVSLCHAIQHAHQRGIIHRDIKPSNVLVTLHDGEPVVKVIDFGIAKALNQQLTEKTVFTRYSQMIGTPEYMSPEQAEMSGLDIDTRTDVFSLGVLLYELLTGTTPFDSEYLLSKGYDELQRIIREEEPLRPSTRLSTMGEAMTQVATDRRTSPKLLCQLIRTDLDWIAMKCLEKDRSRRYESVSEVAADVRRHQKNEPVLAGRPSTVYKILKFTKRNKTLCISSVAVVLILILAVIVSSHQAWIASNARIAESASRVTAEDQRGRAQAAEQQAQGNLYDALVREAQATRIAKRTGYRSKVFTVLQQAYDLDVPQKDPVELRTQTIACLGNPVGLEPKCLVNLLGEPNDPQIRWAALHPTDSLAAFAMSTGAVILKDLQGTRDIARFECEHMSIGLCFAQTGNALLSLHLPMSDSYRNLKLDQTVTHLFVRAQDGTWVQTKTMVVPYAIHCLSTSAGFRVVVNPLSGSAHVMDPLTGDTIHELGFPLALNNHPPIDLSQDGRLLAVAKAESTDSKTSILDVWDLTQNQHMIRLEPNLAECTDVKFSPDGRYLVFLSLSGGFVYSTDTWEPLGHLIEQFVYEPEAIFLTQSPTLVFSVGLRFFLWNFEKQKYSATFDRPQGGARWFSASADDRSLMSHDYKQTWLYSLDTSAERQVIDAHQAGVPSIAFSPDGSHLASISKDRKLRLWNSTTGALARERILERQGQGLSYSANGQWLITTDNEREQVSFWSTKTLEPIFQLGTERSLSTWSAKLTRDHRFLVTGTTHPGSDLGACTLWQCTVNDSGNTDTAFEAEPVKSFAGQIIDVALAPNNQHIAFVNRKTWTEFELYLWDLASTEEPRLFANDLRGAGAQMIEFSPDSQQVRVVDVNRFIVTYDVQSGKKRTSFGTIKPDETGLWSWIIMHKLAPNGTTLAMTSHSGLGVDLWDLKTGRLLYALPEQDGITYYFAWSPNGRRLAIARSNGIIEIWNIAEINHVLTTLKLTP